jgi:hypothetical protein
VFKPQSFRHRDVIAAVNLNADARARLAQPSFG